jgi:Protein of unknown function (DUF2380)
MNETWLAGGARVMAGQPKTAMLALIMFLVLGAMPAVAKDPPRAAVFDFTLINTSGAADTPAELARLARLHGQLQDELRANDRYVILDVAPVRDRLAKVQSIRGCNGCELDLTKELGGQVAAYGWVQKVSNLILNINVVIEDANTGKILKAGSVDIRGNTDETWVRGLRYLLEDHLFRDDH